MPIGSGASEVKLCPGRTGAGIAVGALMGMVMACWAGAAPLSAGTPRDPATLQRNNYQICAQKQCSSKEIT